MKQKYKYYLIIPFAIICLLFSTVTAGAIGTNAMNWYCMHAKDHKQPTAGNEFSFLQQYNGFYIDSIHNEDNPDKVVYLTFDAGYENGNVTKILDILKEKNATGAFFILGNLIERNPDLVLRMADEGHFVCNHTYHHRDMTKLSSEAFQSELTALEEAYAKLTGQALKKYYRPPEGRLNEFNLKKADEMGYKTILWSFGYPDWDNKKQPDPNMALQKIMSNIHNGAVILLHPTSDTNARILGKLIDELSAQGYRFGNLDELTQQNERQ